MLYEAQVAGLADRNPFKPALNPILKMVRDRSQLSVFEKRKALAEAFAERGIAIELFNGGGSGSLNYSARESWLTEVTVGSAFYGPHYFDYFSNVHFEPSCFFALQAVRASDSGMMTCFGGGFNASGEAGPDRAPRPYLPEGLELITNEGCGEVQTPVKGVKPGEVILGEPIIFRHAKAGELMTHFNDVYLLSEGKIVGSEKTYRGLGLGI